MFGIAGIFSANAEAQNLEVVKTRCEYLINPIGIDASAPRFTWQLSDKRQGAKQTAFRLIIGVDSLGLLKGENLVWDSKKQNNDAMLVSYSGTALLPVTKYYWRVASWDQTGKPLNSPVATFETGLMSSTNWKGTWISDEGDIYLKPAPLFRKDFVTKKKVKQARAYIAVAGLFELYVNGKKIGNHRLDPMYTRFDRRNLYVVHDIFSSLQEGENAVGVMLGNGWYNHQSTAVWDFHKAHWRARPTFCMDIRITYEDGTVEMIKSDKSWKTSLGPVIFNSIYTAEHYDARLEQIGWNSPGFDDSKWKGVINRTAPSLNIVSQAMQPVRNVEEIKAQKITRINDTTYVFDLGRNISGVSKISLQAQEGTRLRLIHGERLGKDGRVDLSNIDLHYRPTDNQDPFQTDVFTLSGRGLETFMPRFNYKGFQYVEVTSNRPIQLTKESLKGYFMHSDVPVSGSIKSSNPTINKLWFATNNSYLSNLFGYPTDCPQREKNGWTGDAQIAIETGLYNFDGITVYEKWMADHRDEQQPNGVLPSIIPTNGWGYEWGNGPDWTSTIAIIPWNLYLFYGDIKTLQDCYEPIKRYVDHIDELSPTGLTDWGLGDWVPVKSKSPVELTSTCYYYADAIILSNAAKLFGHTADYEKYSALAAKIKKAFNDKYLNRDTGIYGSGVQTELSVPLYWGLVPEDMKEKVASSLANRVAADHFQLDVGLLGTKAILNALSENGHADVAYRLASNEKYPSWGWWIANGATTLYENWNIQSKYDISLNHIMFGEIGAWLFKGPGGIKPDPQSPGFKNVLLRPHFVPGLSQFEAKHEGPYGIIKSSWKRVGKKIVYEVIVPANSSASVYLESGKVKSLREGPKSLNQKLNPIHTTEGDQFQIEAGTYTFEII